ncbi:hypothetical protein [Neolewinella persica]|uniref:hypothetical protein n=1 Tax=Neolewinella persica TaxID=70998 RepID=UPI0003AB0C0C|nr:hypothetical protein [Neolewinella persica]
MYRLILLLSLLLWSGCRADSSPPEGAFAEQTSDLSDPAADPGYGIFEVEKTKWEENTGCGPNRQYDLFIRPDSGGYLVFDEVLIGEELHNFLLDYVTNPDRLPNYPWKPSSAYFNLVDASADETAWRKEGVSIIQAVYYELWKEEAHQQFGQPYTDLPRSIKEVVLEKFPMQVCLAGPWFIPSPPPPPPPAIE